MAVPKHRTSKSRKNIRRSHHALTPAGVSVCSRCNQPKRPHRVCGNCGHYSDVKKIEVESL